jgi:hypothetical protein
MPIVRSGVYALTITGLDRDKNRGSIQFYVSTANTVLEVITAIENTIIPRVQAVSDMLITGWNISSAAELDDLSAQAVEASDVERKGVFSFGCADGSSMVLQVPSFLNTLVIDGTNTINTTAQAVIDFQEMIISDALLALVRPRNYRGIDINSLVKAPYKRHRASNKG